MRKLHVVTPIWESKTLLPGKTVYLKMDCFQPAGSFKIRGLGKLCTQAVAEGAVALVASSGGNAGMAAAYAGQQLNVPVTVFVPQSTSEFMRGKLSKQGAEVVEWGKVWDETHAHAVSYAEKNGAAYVHPFDHPLIWEGHSSIVDETEQNGIKPDVIVLSVGGGGLLCGVLEGLHRIGWTDVPIIAVETEGAASFNAAIKAGEPVTLPAITSFATSLAAKTVGAFTLPWCDKHQIISHVISDKEALNSLIGFADEFRVLVEPACSAAFSPIFHDQQVLKAFEKVMVIICGGGNVSIDIIEKWKKSI